jgi:hypothetical protein
MAGELTRTSSGLTPAHVALIKLLAAAAVGQLLAESESASETEVAPADERQAVTR